MLDAAQALIDVDWKTGLDKVTWSHLANTEPIDVTLKVKKTGGKLRDVKDLQEEHGCLTVAGISSIMKVPMQIDFYNQTQVVRVYLPEPYVKENKSHVLDNYMNRIKEQIHE